MKRAKTPTFLIELPLAADSVQTSHLRAHLEAGRCLYNALLSEAKKRLRKMRSDPEWQAACAIPRTRKAASDTSRSPSPSAGIIAPVG